MTYLKSKRLQKRQKVLVGVSRSSSATGIENMSPWNTKSLLSSHNEFGERGCLASHNALNYMCVQPSYFKRQWSGSGNTVLGIIKLTKNAVPLRFL